MARKKSRTLTNVELEFMQLVWEGEEVSTEDIQEALRKRGRELSGGSIRKVLSILEGKGYVVRRKEGRAFLYRATVPADKASRTLVRDLLGRAFGGSAALMVAALLDSKEVDEDEMAEIKRLVREHEEG